MAVKLETEQIRMIALFESLTGAHAIDCVIDDEHNRAIFVVKPGHIGLAVGRRGQNVKRVQEQLGMDVEVVEYDEDPAEFIKKVLFPAKVKGVRITERDGRKIAIVDAPRSERGRVIGKGGRNIKKARILAKRHHDIDDVVVV
ncbi:MAG: NusA-like transcription termination signal-binding factor [Methanopyri archaeon]|nr:NusA-like transcription termination signal-binding factor [Methanopyri archaeon]